MGNIFINKNILFFSCVAINFILVLNSHSKIINKYPNLDKPNIKNNSNNQREDPYDYWEMYKKCEELREKQKKLENDIQSLYEKNQDYKLKIEINKIYIKLLYSLIFIFLFVIIIIIILKFYCKLKKKQNLKIFLHIKEKYDESNKNINA